MGRIDVFQLQFELQTAQAEFNKWASDLSDSLERLESGHALALQTGEEEMRKLRERKDALKAEADWLHDKHESELNKLNEAEVTLKAAKAEEERLPKVLQDLRIQVDALSKAMQREEEGLQQMRERNGDKMSVLQAAADRYRQCLGLEFKAEDDGRLQVVFTKVDPSDHNRAFTFHVLILEDGKYEVSNVQPDLAAARDLEMELNATLNFSQFVQKMRKEFKQHCTH